MIWLHSVGLTYITIGCALTAPYGLNAQLIVWAIFGFVFYFTGALLLKRASGFGLLSQIAPLSLGASGGLGMTGSLLLLRPYLAGLSPLVTLTIEVLVGGFIYVSIISALEWRTVVAAATPYYRRFLSKNA